MQYQIPKGLFDILPYSKEEWTISSKWHYLEKIIKKLSIDYNYEEIRTPIFEKTELFTRGVGESSDIVHKELYTFLDKAKREMSLRPEGTASIMRAFIENSLLQERKTHKFFYIGPMFRYDRPQAGRYRQHHQFGVEVIGEKCVEIDFEIIDLLLNLFKRLELKNLKLLINSVGDLESRENYKNALLKYLKPYFNNLSEDSKMRFESNPLRILDSKDLNDIKIVENAPSILEFLSEGSKTHFDNLLALLKKAKIEFEVNPKLVRGLDYYDDVVFEVVSNDLGAQSSLGGGGRYGTLLKNLGGPNLSGVGFACGMERILQLMVKQNVFFPKKNYPFVYIIPMGEKAKEYSIFLTRELRNHFIPTEIDLHVSKLQKALAYASKIEAANVLIIGDEELEKQKFSFKNLETRNQEELSLENIKIEIQKKYLKYKERHA
ncbi:MAG: histidine--tRNA ligase [Chlamydiae bacterium RIFCSPHIGHO2_12_FULL_27_8]|nr:MAG: histidine--tRNA ligase [Chlamydiae bacterium RIFCSPHIGHO2_12_FULL_27_8]